jgi:hypothetical protein
LHACNGYHAGVINNELDFSIFTLMNLKYNDDEKAIRRNIVEAIYVKHTRMNICMYLCVILIYK